MQPQLKTDNQPQALLWPFADYAYASSPQGWNGVVLVGEAPGAEEAKLG